LSGLRCRGKLHTSEWVVVHNATETLYKDDNTAVATIKAKQSDKKTGGSVLFGFGHREDD
jgi:hypothetical protein